MRLLIIQFFLLAAVIACNKAEDKNILFVLKGDVTTVAEFKNDYYNWTQTSGLSDDGEMRMSYLYSRLSDEILYDKGIKEGVEYLPQIADNIKQYKRELIIKTMKARVNSEIYSLDDEITKKYYVENKSRFMRDKLYRLTAVRVKKKDKADEVMSLLKKGESVRVLSARYSDDKQLANNDGDWGLFSQDIMDESWKKAVVDGTLGSILGPFRDSEGYFTIMEISGFAYKRELSYNRAYPLIVKNIIGSKGKNKWVDYQNTMFRNYGVKINLDNLNWK